MDGETGPGRIWRFIPPRVLRRPYVLALMFAFVGVSVLAAAALYVAITPTLGPLSLDEQRTQLAILLPFWWPALLVPRWGMALSVVWQLTAVWGVSRLGVALWLRYR